MIRQEADLLKPILLRIPGYLKLLWGLGRHPRLSRVNKGLLLLGAAYTVSPVDLIPGFIPVVGQLDDLLVLLYAIRWALQRLPVAERDELLAGHPITLEQLEADLQAVQAVLGRLAGGAVRTAGRAGLWGLHTTVRGAGALYKWLRRPRR